MSSCEPEAERALCKHTVEVVDLFLFSLYNPSSGH